LVNNDLIIKTRKELKDSNIGWNFRQQVMWRSFKRELVSGIIKCIYIDCCINMAYQRSQKRFVRSASKEDKKEYKKEYKKDEHA
jgi:hypothetical protein